MKFLGKFKPRTRYISTLVVLGIASVGLFVASIVVEHPQPEWSRVFGSVADACFVSFIIAIAVEPYLRSRFQSETRSDVLWGLFNPHAPDAYQQALSELARSKIFTTSTSWELDFSWEDEDADIIRVTMQARNEAITYDAKGYHPDIELWVLPSSDGYISRYLFWEIAAAGADGWDRNHTFTEAELHNPNSPLVKVDENGRVSLSEAKLANGRFIPSKTSFVMTRKTLMYRHSTGYVPLVYSRPSLQVFFDITGDALGEITVSVFHPETLGRGSFLQESTDSPLKDIRVEGVTMSGQATLITWRRKTQ